MIHCICTHCGPPISGVLSRVWLLHFQLRHGALMVHEQWWNEVDEGHVKANFYFRARHTWGHTPWMVSRVTLPLYLAAMLTLFALAFSAPHASMTWPMAHT